MTPRPSSTLSLAAARLSFLRMPLPGLVGIAAVALCIILAIFGPSLAPHPIGKVVDLDVFSPMSSQFPLGTDYLGRDMLSRVLAGARYTVGIALASVLIASGGGLFLGMCAAVWGGMTDAVLSRALDTLISIPSKMFALVIVAAFGSSIPMLILTAGIIYLPGCYRVARALAVNINSQDFVTAARARGEGTLYIVRKEILPNMTGPMLADFGTRFVFIVLLLSGLSFLGLGVRPPNSDWGALVRQNMGGLWEGAPAVLMPALAIAILTIGVNLLIDNLPGRRNRF